MKTNNLPTWKCPTCDYKQDYTPDGKCANDGSDLVVANAQDSIKEYERENSDPPPLPEPPETAPAEPPKIPVLIDNLIPPENLGTGAPSAETFLRGDQTFAPVAAEPGPQGPAGTPYTPTYVSYGPGQTALDLNRWNTAKIIPTANHTLTVPTTPPAGTACFVIILTSGTTSRTLTFGTGFKTTGTLITGTTTSRVFVVSFISNGTSLYEVSRTIAMPS